MLLESPRGLWVEGAPLGSCHRTALPPEDISLEQSRKVR